MSTIKFAVASIQERMEDPISTVIGLLTSSMQ